MKILKKAALLLCAVLALCGCGEEKAAPEVTGTFCAEILKVGKADAILLTTQNCAVVIDCGEKGDGKEILDLLDEKGFEKIDYLFITHFDQDHVGGAAKVIKSVPIGQIVTPDYEGAGKEYENYLEALNERGLEEIRLTKELHFALDDAHFSVCPPQKGEYAEADNDFSLVISVTHGSNKFLFAGDAETERLKELKSQLDLKHDFLKVPHHGRLDEGTSSFIRSVKPENAVITCSAKNPPDAEVIKLLEKIGCNVYLTEEGDVKAVSDGKTISVTQTEKE